MPSDLAFDRIVTALRCSADHNHDDMVAPVAILWPDKDRQFEALVPRLRAEIPGFLTLGPYVPEKLSGPGIWLRCLVARTLPVTWDAKTIPILYLPGVGRADLRAVENCPKHLQALADLQFRGCFWTHVNGKDWTVVGFLQSAEGGLGLDVAPGAPTHEAALRALVKLATAPVETLRNRRLDAEFFNALVSPDPERDLLGWLNDAATTRKNLTPGEWDAFRSVCKQKFKFDPQTDGELSGAEKLGIGQGAWANVWKRFAEAPRLYPNIRGWLLKAKPMLESGPTWPQENDEAEVELRKALKALANMPAPQAGGSITALEDKHGERRDTVWAQLGEAALANALKHLASLAIVVKTPLAGVTPEAMAESYANGAWVADSAALDALAAVEKAADAEAVGAALQAIYKPWLEAAANQFQTVAKAAPLKGPSRSTEKVPAGTCVLFADGLRFDVAQKLSAVLQGRGLIVDASRHWAALPPVTPTAKPAVSPVADEIAGGDVGDEFRPIVADTFKSLTPHHFKSLLEGNKFQILPSNQTGDSSGTAWTEYGDLDHYGHQHGWKLAQHVGRQVEELAQRIADLLAAGWQEMRVVTDHGWLLMPGGLPKIELPGFLAETRWGRCAVLKPNTTTALPTVPWHWNADVQVVVAPGIGSFKAGLEYTHGSLTLQECLVPQFRVRATPAAVKITIKDVKWVGLRCRVTVDGAGSDCTVDLRTKAGDPGTSIAKDQAEQLVKPDGSVAVLVDNDDLMGSAAVLVVLDATGQLAAKRNTTVGGEE